MQEGTLGLRCEVGRSHQQVLHEGVAPTKMSKPCGCDDAQRLEVMKGYTDAGQWRDKGRSTSPYGTIASKFILKRSPCCSAVSTLCGNKVHISLVGNHTLSLLWLLVLMRF